MFVIVDSIRDIIIPAIAIFASLFVVVIFFMKFSKISLVSGHHLTASNHVHSIRLFAGRCKRKRRISSQNQELIESVDLALQESTLGTLLCKMTDVNPLTRIERRCSRHDGHDAYALYQKCCL